MFRDSSVSFYDPGDTAADSVGWSAKRLDILVFVAGHVCTCLRRQ